MEVLSIIQLGMSVFLWEKSNFQDNILHVLRESSTYFSLLHTFNAKHLYLSTTFLYLYAKHLYLSTTFLYLSTHQLMFCTL